MQTKAIWTRFNNFVPNFRISLLDRKPPPCQLPAMEGIQPNEIRHVHKGGPAVAPVVQAASSRVFRRADDDHESRNERRLHASSDWPTPVDNRGASLHPMSSDTGPNLRSASIIQDQDHIAKRRRLNHSTHQHRDRPTRFDVLLDLPIDCVPGVPGCRDRRRKWVDAQIAIIRRERDAIVYMHTVRGLQATFSCRSLAFTPGDEPGTSHLSPDTKAQWMAYVQTLRDLTRAHCRTIPRPRSV